MDNTVRTKRSGLIAMLDSTNTQVTNIFKLQKDAAAHVTQRLVFITNSIKKGTPVGSNYFAMWDDLADDIKNTFVGEVPNTKPKSRGRSVQQLDPNTREIIETHPSIAEVVAKFKMSPQTVRDVAAKDTLYKGFYWKMV